MRPTRRQVIRSLVGGSMLFPGIVAHLLADEARGGANPLAPKAPHFPGNAKRVIFLYMSGGVPRPASFAPKPNLAEAAATRKPGGRAYVKPRWEFKPRGQCGTEV